MDQNAFAYPKLHYFKSGNPFTGSYKGMNYMLTPQKGEEESSLEVAVWYGPFCSSVSEMVAQISLPLSDDGLEQSRAFLWEQYAIFCKNSAESEN